MCNLSEHACDKSANYLPDAIRRDLRIRARAFDRSVGAKIEIAARMFGYDGHDRRKNPLNPMVREWRRALQNEWEADKRRRETHREEPRRDRPHGDEPPGGRGGGGDR
jgi:hypothetical protein